jgi:hypothetical protein
MVEFGERAWPYVTRARASIPCAEKIPGRTTTSLPNRLPLSSYILLGPNPDQSSRKDSSVRHHHIYEPFCMALASVLGGTTLEVGMDMSAGRPSAFCGSCRSSLRDAW